MARYDKYDPIDGGFRAALAADWDATADGVDIVVAVGLDASGRVVAGGGNTGVLGVWVPMASVPAGDTVDVMTDGEIVDVASLTAGTVYYADATTGSLTATPPAVGANAARVGHTVEADRLVVRVSQVQG